MPARNMSPEIYEMQVTAIARAAAAVKEPPHPEIYEMQVTAIARAAAAVKEPPHPEIMIGFDPDRLGKS
jgi:hypothetical protein